ncbi:uncharacterized protein ACRADG_004066 [Cochliomyia hominivorax]
MKFNAILKYLLLLHCVTLIICENYYTIIAPGVLKSNRKYNVVVTLHDSNSPCTIRVGVTGRSYNISDEVQLQPFETKKIEFFPPKLEKGDYKLMAIGVKGCIFRNESELFIDETAGPKIYIQTDKSVYKPMDLVQFRVVILDEHTRPVNIKEPIRIEIYDKDKNRVKQFKDIVLIKGVFTGQFQLSQQPVMGDWEIRVIISGRYSHQNSKNIKVKLYTLPKFSVFIQAPENFLLDDPHIEAEIFGKYTFDKYVQGILNVEIGDFFAGTLFGQQTLHIDGLVTVKFDLDPSKIANVYGLFLRATLEEKNTGVSQNYKTFIPIRKKRYNILIPDDEIEFRNNKPFRLRAHVEHWNDGPVWDSSTPVVMEHGDKKYETYLNEDGVAVFEFDHQRNAAHTFTYKGVNVKYPNIFVPEETKEVQYCKLTLAENPRLGKPVEIKVRSSFNIPYLVYLVGHAGIVRQEHIKVPPNRKMHSIKINPSVEMIPTSYLYVHYVLDGNLRYEELTLKFPRELENLVSVSAPKQAKPGQEVTLNLKAQPKSYVSILAVDLSVYILDNTYDLYKHNIINDLDADKSYIPDAHIKRPGIISGLITLTNAHYPIRQENYNPVSPGFAAGLIFRTKFPETWIFKNYIINNTETEIKLNIPDTITTWRITAFSNNDITGFGIVDGPTDITTILPFFITFDLPFSVKRDEILTIPITLFNYHNQSLDTEITMYNEDLLFNFLENINKISSSREQTKHMTIPADGGKTVKFLIKPLRIGEIEIRVSAQNSVYSDGIVKILNVIPEGVIKYQNRAAYLSGAGSSDSSLSLDIPLDSVSDSELITLSVGGDFMIPTLNNLNDIIKMPTGCGEQNMVNFASNTLILDYLKAIGKYSKEIKLANQAKHYIEIGYQQQLSYRHENGGFSVFGTNHSEEVSNWLTAYVTRFFIKASKYLPIETRIIDSALEYLANEQWSDGSFPFKGYLFYKEIQNKYGFTAFVLLTFMEDRKYSRKYQTNIRKGLDFLTADLYNINDVYELSLMAYALSKGKHPAADKVREKLESFRKEDENGLMWWMGSGTDIETTAYILMSLLDAPGNHLPILKWLIQQRNEQGGFKSSHDTVVGLEALVKYSQKYNNNKNWDLKISYSAQDQEGIEKKIDRFQIDRENALTLQRHELPRSVRQVKFEIEGSGYSLVQLSSRYNIKNDNETKHFTMKIKPTLYDDQEMDLEICFTYHALMQDISNSTNMVIMEANLPSGFMTEADMSTNLLENEFIQRIELQDEDTKILLYFDKLSTEVKHCVTIESFKANEVKQYKPSAIVMYDYYNTSRFNSEFYTIYNESVTKLTLPIPDTITTWRITAFSNNNKTGFGIVNGPTDITTIQPFFISLNLPYSVKRGEIVTVAITIFNYLKQKVDTEVIFYNNEREFYFMESKVEEIQKSSDQDQIRKNITIEADKAITFNCLIYPIKSGEVNIRISATNDLYSDAISQKLRVEPEGVIKEKSQSLYLSIPAGEKIIKSFTIQKPNDTVPDSDYITFTVGGHYLVPTVENFQDLIHMPTGCGEQNMVNFAPSVLILEYLKANGKLTKEKDLVDSLRSAIEDSYQQQLSFRHANGGFSVFGMSTDEEPSTWLTAYVVRYFIKASQFIAIENKVIETGLKYLADQQKSNGEFPFTGYLLNPKHKSKYGLAAFILLAFLESEKYAPKYQLNIHNTIEFLNSNLNNIDDLYEISLIGTTIKRAKHQNAYILVKQLQNHVIEMNGCKWWSGMDQNLANDIEITSYAAMCLLDTPGDHTSILKWLVEQRNSNGGFKSSYDTVVAKDQEGYEVDSNEVRVDSSNIFDLQKYELPNTTREVIFEMEGNGVSLVQLTHQYNLINEDEFRHFLIEPKPKFKNSQELNLEICFTYQSDSNVSIDATNMIIMEVNLPSGFISDAENSKSLKEHHLVCLEILADKKNDILMPKPAAILIYYTIIAPGTIKSNRKYSVIITLHDSNAPCTICISITGRSFNSSNEVQLQPFETKSIEFFPPKLERGDYNLLAEGLKGCVFRNQTELFAATDVGPKIYIQTDRSVYKPLDRVQFRVVILDEHTRPVNIQEPIRVEIYDNAKNRVKQFKDITLTKGVFTGKFHLSQQPVMGNWEIRVTISGRYSHQKSKYFTVKFYILPKFSVHIEGTSVLITDEPHIQAEIYGKYTFDKYVQGILNVELRILRGDKLIEQQIVPIDSLVSVEFNLSHMKNLKDIDYLILRAVLEEKDTGIKQNDTHYIQVQEQRYRILIPDDEIEFRNNKPFRLKAHVEDLIDGPVWDSMTPVTMQHGNKIYETYLNEDGVAIFEFEHQQDDSYLVKFKDVNQTLPNIFIFPESNERHYCRLKLKGRPILGKPLEVQVRSSFNIPYLVYTVMGHASIVRMEHIKVPANRKVHTIRITPSIEMIPTSYLYVHYVLDGNLRYEEITLKFPKEFENQIKISAPKKVKPGQEVTLTLKAQPKSYVSVLAVDLSVYLLDKNYDIYKTPIMQELEHDKSHTPNAIIANPGTISGLVTLTNAHYPVIYQINTDVAGTGQRDLIFRQKFPETWIFENYIINNTETDIILNIPDTITSWLITAFSNNDVTGFGIVDGPTSITTILPFFITFDLPHSVKNGEIVIITVSVFNYHNQSLDTEIIMYNRDLQFHFMESPFKLSSNLEQRKTLTVPANNGKTIKFLIRPSKIGEIEIRIAAKNSMFEDGVVKKLNVIPEGITKYQNKAMYISSVTGDISLTVDIPLDSVTDSEYISLSVGGHFMIPALENLNDMIKMPTGCGEQNMVNFAPNVLILDYLKATGQYLKELKLVNQAKSFLEIGYQQELSFRHSSGGYSVFGPNFTKDSTWLTAYVARFFIKASKYIPIESHIIDSALEFLANNQKLDGSFLFTGYLFYNELQYSYSFTAFVLLTFLEDRKYSRKYQIKIRKALDFLSTDLYYINDIYELSLMAAALSKAKHPGATKVIEKLQNYREENEKGLVWWEDVEITSYVLMSLLDIPGNHLPILKWLIEQRNDRGGFKTSHDTVVGLEALVKFSQKYNNASNWDLNITYAAQDHEGNEMKLNNFLINNDNALTLQQHELPRSVRQVNLEIHGNGYSLIQLSSRYNIKNDDNAKHFVMRIRPTIYNDEEMDLEICFTYHALNQHISNSTNMVIMEANLPSGFQTEAEFRNSLEENEFIQRVDTKDEETVAILYFDKLSTEVKHCVIIETFRANEVADRKPTAVVMYDYYNTTKFISEFYTV